MKTNNTTFEQAFAYLLQRRGELNLTTVAEKIGIERPQLSSSVSGKIQIPKKHRQGVVTWFESTQITNDTTNAV